ncbi:YwiC-like family protein [Streptomyces sp. BI20]|uniref:YwiC-like family protein n=1 Tax=Streptomyces sp. BI20 TaxID=3403460 RepID=UPI003C73C161
MDERERGGRPTPTAVRPREGAGPVKKDTAGKGAIGKDTEGKDIAGKGARPGKKGAAGKRGGRKKVRWIPDQHGAWAMLAVPFLAGTLLAPHPTPWHALLLPTWVLGYIASFHAQQWLRLRRLSRNPRAAGRHVRPALVLGGVFAACALPLAWTHPWLLLAAGCAAPFVAVNTWHAWRNRERALVNGLAAVVPACGMLVVTLVLGGGTPAEGWAPALACLLYFGGTVPYVKTMIREKNSPGYRRASIALHAVLVPAAAALSPWLALPFAGYLLRAVVMPRTGAKVAVVGAVEVLGSLALLLTLTLAF